jgi:hypothetical protein
MRGGLNFVLALSLIVVLISCDHDDPKTSRLEVRLTDAPGDYEEVNIDIQDVQVNSSSDEKGWTSLDVHEGVYDLLKLTNGLDTLLGTAELPAGKISQVRLILGSNNSITVAGETISLSTPSAQQSGLKLQVHAELLEGITYTMLLDFDAAKSIVHTGNGKYILKPVLRTVVEAESGAIKGAVTPVSALPAVYVIEGSDTVGTTFTEPITGKFLVKGLEAGTYRVAFSPKTGYETFVKENVTVTVGSVTDLGTLTFP